MSERWPSGRTTMAALNNRGTALKGLKRYGEALARYEEALVLSPRLADALYNSANL